MDRRAFLGTITAAGAAVLPQLRPRTVAASELPADLTALSASALSAAIRDRHASCVEVMTAYLDRIDRLNPVYNAIVSRVPRDALLARAREADDELAAGRWRGWMHGMPHAVKDLADVAGLPTSSGSPLFAGRIAQEDSAPIARIRAAGALFLGKTNTPEFGMGSQTYNPVFGATGSACDPALTAGGSSGGAASGLGTRMLPVADGSDMMGSLRNPGAFNNVIGFRPTVGRVSSGGAGNLFFASLATSGPMGRNAEDTIRLLGTMAGADARDPLALRDELPEPSAFDAATLRGLRIGWLGDYDGYLPMEPGILELCERSLGTVADRGAVVEPCMPAFAMDRLWRTWLTLRHWGRNGMLDLYEDPRTRAQLKPEAVWEIEGSFPITSRDLYEAGRARGDWFDALLALFERFDLLALPTAQVFPFPREVHWPARIAEVAMDTYHRWMEVVIGGSLAGLPVVNVPVGFDGEGRPMGMQVMGPFGADRAVLEFALAYERVTDFLGRTPVPVAAEA